MVCSEPPLGVIVIGLIVIGLIVIGARVPMRVPYALPPALLPCFPWAWGTRWMRSLMPLTICEGR